jgi:hypothetical protein
MDESMIVRINAVAKAKNGFPLKGTSENLADKASPQVEKRSLPR